MTRLFNKNSHFVPAGSDLVAVIELKAKPAHIYNNLNKEKNENYI